MFSKTIIIMEIKISFVAEMTLPKLHFLLASVAVFGVSLASTPLKGQASSLRSSGTYEQAAAPLRDAPSRTYKFSAARLTDVLRLMAEDAGINFISLPSDETNSSRLVTFTMEASPFAALETLAEENGIALVYNGRFWSLKPSNSSELVPRTYPLEHSTKEKVTVNVSTGGGASTTGGVGGQGGGLSTGISLQGETHVFEVEPSELVEEIKALLGIPSQFSGALLSNEAYLEAVRGLGGVGEGVAGVLSPGSTALVESEDASNGAKVLWVPDTNSLFVLATQLQHQWVEEYLSAVDQPQTMIAVEVKFFETTKDPREQIGTDWTSVLGDTGFGLSLSDLSTEVDLNQLSDMRAPETAVLSATDIDIRLRALLQDRETTQVSYPRVLTLNNKEVVIRSVVNEPVLAASSSTSPGAGSTSTQSTQYLPIGTVINILPRQMNLDTVLLNVQLTISSIIGEKILAGNPYPIANSRVFNAPLQVKSGYTVAIAGLDEALNSNGKSAVPILNRLPVLGQLFRNRDNQHSRKNLMMFITPTLLPSKTQGVSKKPQSVYSNLEETPASTAPYDQLAAQWSRELDLIQHVAAQGQPTKEDYLRADQIYHQSAGRIKLTKSYRQGRLMDEREASARISALTRINERAQKARKDLWYLRR